MVKLGVNIDHVATLRQQRKGRYPDPVTAAAWAELGGADNITCHLREDRRHIQDRDLKVLRDTIQTELNLEMAATQEMLRTALEVKPEVVTLVPEKRQELTTEGGLDLVTHGESVGKAVGMLREAGLMVSLFVDPNPETIKLAHRTGAQAVEIHTGRYAEARKPDEKKRELARVLEAVTFATKLRLSVHAGHGLDYQNVEAVAQIRPIESFQIGFAIVSRALFVGLEEAVREMKRLIVASRNSLAD
ncbi:MAG: pyridoxine 5'-phosphate synthase [Pseudomonadota bacterium]